MARFPHPAEVAMLESQHRWLLERVMVTFRLEPGQDKAARSIGVLKELTESYVLVGDEQIGDILIPLAAIRCISLKPA
jgi:hypothetical protein